MAMKLRLYILRHGITQWNMEKRYLGHYDIGIAEQAVEVLEALRPELEPISFDRVYCSDLRRCRESLTLAAPQWADQAAYDARLREMDFGAWEGLTYEELMQFPAYSQWLEDPTNMHPPEGESWQQFEKRVGDFLTEMQSRALQLAEQKEDQSVSFLVVTHGGVIRQMMASLTGAQFWDTAPIHGRVLELEMIHDQGSWQMLEERSE